MFFSFLRIYSLVKLPISSITDCDQRFNLPLIRDHRSRAVVESRFNPEYKLLPPFKNIHLIVAEVEIVLKMV
jgi:hypothetical protein